LFFSADFPCSFAALATEGEKAMKTKWLTRRRLLATSAAASAVAITAPFVRTAGAAGKLTIGLWDHFVPTANKTSDELVQEWGAKEKVEVQIDRYTGNKSLLTLAAEAQARSGHDFVYMTSWLPQQYAKSLEPVDDVMAQLINLNGPVTDIIGYLGRADGHWLAVPATIGNQIQGPCSRIDLMKQYAGIDVQAMYPAGAPPKADNWTLDAFLKAAQACHKAGFPFGIGLGTTEDSVVAAGVIFQCFGAVLVDANGKITVKSDPVREALDYYTRLARFFPPDAPAWDNTSNNKYLIAGKGSLILNPPSAWAVAKRDAPQVAEKLWTHGMPAGPKGRFAPCLPFFWGIWNFSKSKDAAKSLLMYLSQPSSIERLVAASGGFDLPPFTKFSTLKTWAEEGPPKGTLYHYPNPHNHQILSIAGAPSPPKIAAQIFTQGVMTKMTIRHMQGEAMEKTLAWAEGELEGFMRI
jgi:ABC-type glycerol-3-phosphate transport system substrate-binding protein